MYRKTKSRLFAMIAPACAVAFVFALAINHPPNRFSQEPMVSATSTQ